MSDDVTVLEDEIEAYADNTVARVRVLDVPESDKFPEGIKYAFHYGEAGGDDPVIRFDNHHGVHELHTGPPRLQNRLPRTGRHLPSVAGGTPRRETHRLVTTNHPTPNTP